MTTDHKTSEDIAILKTQIGHLIESDERVVQMINNHMEWEEKNNEKNTASMERQEKKLIEMIKDIDERKADKITQTIVFSLVGIILAGVVTALISLIIVK